MTDSLLDKYEIKYPRCGFDLPSGWVKLVDELIPKLITAGWDKDLHQVKEKFGGLRFYIGEGSEEVNRLINEAEDSSFKICIVCGSSENVTQAPGFWIEYSCDECKKAKR